MIVHIIPDNFFLDVVIPLLLEVSTNQRFVALSGSLDNAAVAGNAIKKYRDKVDFMPAVNVKAFCRSLSQSGIKPFVVFHCLTGKNVQLIKELANDFIMGWVPWGGCDIYDYLSLHGRLAKTFCNEFLEVGLHSKVSLLLHLIKHGVFYKLIPYLDPYVRIRRMFKWCFALTKEDYRQYRMKFGVSLFPACFSEISYWCYDFDSLPSQIKFLDVEIANHLNIMIGNMGSPKYNHREVYDILKKVKLPPNGKVYASFGYGKDVYSKSAISYGQVSLGKCFCPITSWMPKDDYFTLISSCGIYIANHVVQGGLGTMQLALMAGCKLYLNEKGATYKIFKEIGFIVFPLPKSPGKEFLTQLSLTEKKHNQSLCLDYWGREKVIKRFQRMVEICERESNMGGV